MVKVDRQMRMYSRRRVTAARRNLWAIELSTGDHSLNEAHVALRKISSPFQSHVFFEISSI